MNVRDLRPTTAGKGERGRQIRAWRIAMGHTQLSLAVAIGAHPMTLSKWERGVAEPHRVFYDAVLALHVEFMAANESPAFGLCPAGDQVA